MILNVTDLTMIFFHLENISLQSDLCCSFKVEHNILLLVSRGYASLDEANNVNPSEGDGKPDMSHSPHAVCGVRKSAVLHQYVSH